MVPRHLTFVKLCVTRVEGWMRDSYGTPKEEAPADGQCQRGLEGGTATATATAKSLLSVSLDYFFCPIDESLLGSFGIHSKCFFEAISHLARIG